MHAPYNWRAEPMGPAGGATTLNDLDRITIYIYKIEQIQAVDRIADSDSNQPRSALAPSGIERRGP